MHGTLGARSGEVCTRYGGSSEWRSQASKLDHLTLSGMKIEVGARGKGTPLLLLYGEEAARSSTCDVLDELARDHELIIPSPPGFGASERPTG